VCELAPDMPAVGAGTAAVALRRRPMDPIRPDLLALFERDELLKYLTDEELDA